MSVKDTLSEERPFCISSASAGYAEMEAQFAWDDKNIRRTFIRKVPTTDEIEQIPPVQRGAHQSSISIALTECLSTRRCTPFSCFSCLWPSESFVSSHFGNRCSISLLLHPLLLKHAYLTTFPLLPALLWGFIFRLIPACTWHLSKWEHAITHIVTLFFYMPY